MSIRAAARVARIALLLAAAAVATPALATQERAAPGLADAAQSIAARQLVPGYARLAEATGDLHRAADTLCAAPTARTLALARERYHQAMDAWMPLQHVQLGPVQLFLRHYRFQLWPDKRNAVSRQLATLVAERDPKIEDADELARASVAVQGFPALERLLFGEDSQSLVRSDAPEQAYRCRLVGAITANLAAMAAAVHGEWIAGDPPFTQVLARPGPDNPYYPEATDVGAALLRDLASGLQMIAELKLARPLGQAAGEERPRLAESWRSARSLRNISLNLEGLHGTFTAGGERGLAALAAAGGAEAAAERIAAGLHQGAARARALGDTLGPVMASAEGRAELVALLANLETLRELLRGPVAEALDLPFGFNSLDGD